MNTPLQTWFERHYSGGRALDVPYRALVKDGRTYVLGRLSDIAETRKLLRVFIPPRPVTAVMAVDAPVGKDAPFGRWLGVTPEGLMWYEHDRATGEREPITLGEYNDTNAACSQVSLWLRDRGGGGVPPTG